MRARVLEASLVGAAAVLLTVIMMWPIAPRILTAGRSDSGDGRFSIWNVAWVAHALVTDPLHVYDANIFHPHTRTLTYSKPNIGAGALAIPFYWLGGRNPHFSHNAVQLLAFVFALAGMYALVKHLSGARGVRYLLVHMDYYGDGVGMKKDLERFVDYLRPLYTKDPVWLYEIVAWPPSR